MIRQLLEERDTELAELESKVESLTRNRDAQTSQLVDAQAAVQRLSTELEERSRLLREAMAARGDQDRTLARLAEERTTLEVSRWDACVQVTSRRDAMTRSSPAATEIKAGAAERARAEDRGGSACAAHGGGRVRGAGA